MFMTCVMLYVFPEVFSFSLVIKILVFFFQAKMHLRVVFII